MHGLRCGVRSPLLPAAQRDLSEWNELVRRGDWQRANERLHSTNNFSEFTGRLCPAPCEAACVLELGNEAVTIKEIEVAIADEAFARGWVKPRAPRRRTGRVAAVVAAAQQLNGAGHAVTVYERAERLGGLLRYGIPDYKMHKSMIDRRIGLLAREGIAFEPGCDVGTDLSAEDLTARSDATVLAVGAERARVLGVPGHTLPGVVPAMAYLVQQNRHVVGDAIIGPTISVQRRDVVIIGGSDTATDCLGNAYRERAASVTELSIYPSHPHSETARATGPFHRSC